MIVQNKGSRGYHRDLMNHRMETIFWLTKHSDFVLSHRVDVQPGKPEHAVCLHGWDKGSSQKSSGRNPALIHSIPAVESNKQRACICSKHMAHLPWKKSNWKINL